MPVSLSKNLLSQPHYHCQPTMSQHAQQVKLRASCDSCSEARVRCSRSQPSCDRCSKNNMTCEYGVSKRAGRHSASGQKNRGPARTSKTGVQTLIPLQPAWPPAATRQGWTLNDSGLAEHGITEERMPLRFDNFSLNCQKTTHSHDITSISPSNANLTDIPAVSAAEQMTLADFSVDNNQFDEFIDLATTTAFSLPKALGETGSQDTSDLESSPQSAICNCLSMVVSFLFSHPMLTGNDPCPLDLCLVQGRRATNLCKRVLSCQVCYLKDYGSLLALSLLIDRIIATYERASRDYSAVVSKNTTPLTETPSSLSTGDSPSLATGLLSTFVHDVCETGDDIEAYLKGHLGDPALVRITPAFIGTYRLDSEDRVKLTFEIVLRHLCRINLLIAGFKNAESRAGQVNSWDHGEVLASFALADETDGQGIGHKRQSSTCLGLADLLERKLSVVRSGWERNLMDDHSSGW
jgi:hypothetical protein